MNTLSPAGRAPATPQALSEEAFTAAGLNEPPFFDDALIEELISHAKAIDAAEEEARRILPFLGEKHFLDRGAPSNKDGDLTQQVAIVATTARYCMSSAFTVWAQRMTIEYLSHAGTPYAFSLAEDLRTGQRPGVTGMASAFKAAVGAGNLDLTARPEGDNLILNGTLRWASNLYPDSVIVTAAQDLDKDRGLIIATSTSEPGVTINKPFNLLGLNATASSSIEFKDVVVPQEAILSEDSSAFCAEVRPTFACLQTAMCIGLAQACVEATDRNLPKPLNEVFHDDVEALAFELGKVRSQLQDIASAIAQDDSSFTVKDVLSMRLRAAEIATSAANLEVRTAGGAGYAKSSPSSRRFREASFLPVQSPSEAQLQWELKRINS